MEIKVKHLGGANWNVSLWYYTDQRCDKTVSGLPAMIATVLEYALLILN